MSLNNNNRGKGKGLKLFKVLALVGFMIDIITLGAIFVVLGHDVGGPLECSTVNKLCPHDTTPLGTWISMPSVDTELMGNQSYRNLMVFSTASAGFNIGLTVGCINPSNTVGAKLRVQSAQYSFASDTNTTNFADVGASVLIDNSLNQPCPGVLTSGPVSLVAQSASVNFLFRVVGSGGGGSGDNPRFSFINLFLTQNVIRVPEATVFSTSTTTIRVFIQVTPTAVTASTVENFVWIATNSTSGTCGVVGALTDTCIESGTSSCTIATGGTNCNVIVTFATAFTGTVNGVASPKNLLQTQTLFVGTMDFLLAQTLTV